LLLTAHASEKIVKMENLEIDKIIALDDFRKCHGSVKALM
jgi:hypothetical protein